MQQIDFSARVSFRRLEHDGPLNGKFLYIHTDAVFPGQMAGFWSSKKTTESPSSDDGTSFEFQRKDFYWVCWGAYPQMTFLLTLDLSTLVIAGTGQDSVKDALYYPGRDSLARIPLAPWQTYLPEVKPSDRRDGLAP